MDDETTLLGFRPHIRNDTYMVEPTAEIPRYYITGKIVVAVVANRNRFTLAIEVSHQVQDATMIDIAVRTACSPFFWVFRPGTGHVFMYFLLQINSRLAKRANNDIRTNSGFVGDIARWIINLHIRRIVACCDTRLGHGTVDNLF